MREKMMMIMTKEELERVTSSAGMLLVDLHGLTVHKAKRLLSNLIAINSDCIDICAIHGYNHGTAIKEMIHRSFVTPEHLSIKNVEGNYGRTIVKVA